MKKNQIYITTGFQLLNTLEYLNFSGKMKDFNEVVVVGEYLTARKGVENILKLHKWNNVIFLFPKWLLTIKNKLIRQILMNLWAKVRIDLIFDKKAALLLGSYHNLYCQYVFQKIENNNSILLDDGSSSIEYGDTVILKRRLIEKIFGLKKTNIIPTFFFTAYKDILDRKGISDVTLEENRYTYLRSLKQSQKTGSEVYFIGAPLVEQGYIKEEEYLEKINKLKKLHKLIYVPHPREKHSKVAEIANSIFVLKTDVPFELYLVAQNELPKLIIGYHTSVIFNVNKLFGDKIPTNYIKLKDTGNLNYANKLISKYEELDLISSELKI